MWPKLWHMYAPYVEKPFIQEWENMFGQWNLLPHAIGTIDGTFHYIQHLEDEQGTYYSGHHSLHCIHTQV